MILTVLEAEVAPEKWGKLEEAFKHGSNPLPEQISESSLVQNSNNPNLWRINTIWRSRQALDDYRQSVDTPEGVTMFRGADAEPTLSVFEVCVHATG